MKTRLFLTFTGLILVVSCVFSPVANAASARNFRPGRIIDDRVFTNYKSMNAQQIQNFLTSKVPRCDTNGTKPYGGTTRAQYGRSHGNPPPFTCLKSYKQGGKSAAQIIYEAGRDYRINPQVLIALLQKEQGLVTDDWPWKTQYKSATGYGCPDHADCNSQYYGFTNQVRWAAKMFRAIMNDSPSWYSPYVVGNNEIKWHPNSSCGTSTVRIENRSTLALYSYTPYRPNQAALNAGYGMGNSCSSYGNRNFYLYFTDWFGSPHNSLPYSWELQSRVGSLDEDLGDAFKRDINLAPGGKAYIQVKVHNTGTEGWNTAFTRLGASNPQDRQSAFRDDSWESDIRAARLEETTVYPGEVGTFNFSITAPSTLGTYKESFNVVAEGRRWMRGENLTFTINVTNTTSPISTDNILSSGESLDPHDFLLSRALHSSFVVQGDGNVVLYNNFTPEWYTNTSGKNPKRLTMQTDGNLVLRDTTNKAIWNSGTSGNANARLAVQTDGNLVVYSNANQPLWNSGTISRPDGLAYVNTTLPTGKLYPGQQLETANRKYKVSLQTDGNLVLRSDSRVLWSSGTYGKDVDFASMQSDGNLVLGNTSGGVIWHTHTGGRGVGHLVMQGDGNLVLYDGKNKAAWHTHTAGEE